MKFVQNILKKIKPPFEKGGSLHSLYPAYDAFATFLFVPNHTSSNGTHIRDSVDLKRTMVMVIIALLPCLLFGMWNVGYQYHSQLDTPPKSQKRIVSPPKMISPVGERIRYLPKPVGPIVEPTFAPIRWSRTRNVKLWA